MHFKEHNWSTIRLQLIAIKPCQYKIMHSRFLKLLFCSHLIINSIWPGSALAAQTEATPQKRKLQCPTLPEALK